MDRTLEYKAVPIANRICEKCRYQTFCRQHCNDWNKEYTKELTRLKNEKMNEEAYEILQQTIKKALKTEWSELPNGRFNVDIEVTDDDIAVWCINAELEEGGEE